MFNQFGDLERCLLRPGNVHSAEDWRVVLEPVLARYRERGVELYFRADAAFAKPELYETLEAEGVRYAIRLPANRVLLARIGHLLTRPVGRPPKKPQVFFASFSYQAQSWAKPRRVVAKVEWHQGELYPRIGFIVTNLTRPAERVVRFYNGRGTAEQWIKEGKQALRWTRLSCRAFRANAVRLQMLWGRRRGRHHRRRDRTMEGPMSQPNDLSRSLAALEQESTLIAVIEMSQASWLVAGIVPGIERHPAKRLKPDEGALLRLLQGWRDEAVRAGRTVARVAVAFEAGRDGFWLARWLGARGIEAHVIHPTSVAVSRDHRRAKTDRLDAELLKRAFLGWLRGERGHCRMAAVPTLEAEDARRPSRERDSLVGERTRIVNRMKGTLARLGIRGFKPASRKAPELLEALVTPEGVPLPPNTLAELRRDMARLRFVLDQIEEIEATRLHRLDQAPHERSHAMVRLLARVIGVGIETADMLVHEVLSRDLRDRRAVARYAGLTGAPDESGSRRREKGLAKAGNTRVRRGMIQLAWRFLLFQPDSALAQWYRARTADAGGGTRETLIVALARKLLIALWRLVTTGAVPEGVALRPAG